MHSIKNEQVEPTVAGNRQPLPAVVENGFSLVQIYPVNIIDGMKRMDADVITIGRDATNDLTLDDSSVSRHHSRIEKTDAGYALLDLGSTNGTFVDEKLVIEQILRGGETIRFGSHIFKFLNSGIESQYHQTVYSAMTRDGLTQAYNKNYMLDALQHELIRSQRLQRPCSVLLLDVDHFKKINDTFGHLAGDQVLREFCHRLQSSVHSDHLVCRYGGEEFVIILGETDRAEAIDIAEGCRMAVCRTDIATSVGSIPTTVSIGVAISKPWESPETCEEILKRADDQLYEAKRSGRNRVSHKVPSTFC
ncbi:MAG: GGDEF domain-containing protein [Pirellulales bacterium]